MPVFWLANIYHHRFVFFFLSGVKNALKLFALVVLLFLFFFFFFFFSIVAITAHAYPT